MQDEQAARMKGQLAGIRLRSEEGNSGTPANPGTPLSPGKLAVQSLAQTSCDVKNFIDGHLLVLYNGSDL